MTFTANHVLKMPNMLMIGGASSNTGKTILSCALIEKFRHHYPIEAIKVTTIRDKGHGCPRGGVGCGVCSSMDGKFCIVEELDSTTSKDTSRLLAAGCRRVFWLRALKEHLAEGFQELKKRLSQDALYLCESNSLRNFVEPSLFLFVKATNNSTIKDSAREIQAWVDREIEWDGNKFSIDLHDINIVSGQWTLFEQATAIILAGGKSSRMGQNKALLPIQNTTMIQNIVEQIRSVVKEIIISTSSDTIYSIPNVINISDDIKDQGPLYGIIKSMKSASYPLCFVMACDIPNVPVHLMRRMIQLAHHASAVVPEYDHALEPLFAVYSRNLLPMMEQSFANGNRQIRQIYKDCSVTYLPIDTPIINLNTMNQYTAYIKQDNTQDS